MEINKLIKDINNDPFSADSLNQEELEAIIKFANDAFFNTKKPIMNDNTYDILKDFLKSKFPKSKVLKEIGATIKSKDKVKLDYWLGSMDKIKPGSNELEKWLHKYKDKYILSDKLDGISALLVYRTTNHINLYTRGTASEGLDITPLLKYFNIPSIDTIKNSGFKSNKKNILMAFRGELILDKKTFETNWSNIMKNGRNTVSGLVNSKKINPKLAMDTHFVVYEIVDPIMLPDDQLKLSNVLGFDTVNYKLVTKISYDLLSEYLKKRRSESEFIIDGIIVTNNEIYERNKKSNPEYAFAFKDILEDQMAETTILEIEWNISKDGLYKPTLILKPVEIGGVEIHRVTGHNARNVVDKKLGKGAVIKLIRSGDVIPHVQEVIKPSNKVELPLGDWRWNETNVDIIIKSLDNRDVLIKNIHYFFSKLDTKGLGDAAAEKLVSAGFNSVKKILEATDFTTVEGFKEKSSTNLVSAIKKSTTNVKLSKLMAATNKLGAGLGEERIKQVIDAYPNLLLDYIDWSKGEFIDKLIELNGWEEKTSTQFVNNFQDFIKFYNSIKQYITIEINNEKKIIKNKYTNKIIVISGFRDATLHAFLEDSGAKLTNAVSKNTDLLIVQDQDTIDKATGKVKKAQELGITIVTRDKIKL